SNLCARRRTFRSRSSSRTTASRHPITVVVIPAIDILGGRCVRLTRGDYENPTIYADDPVEVARRFAAAGAKRVHVVDLDAARGSASNRPVITKLLELSGIELQVAGGVRTAETVAGLLEVGAQWVVMATAAVRDPHVFERCAIQHPAECWPRSMCATTRRRWVAGLTLTRFRSARSSDAGSFCPWRESSSPASSVTARCLARICKRSPGSA